MLSKVHPKLENPAVLLGSGTCSSTI